MSNQVMLLAREAAAGTYGVWSGWIQLGFAGFSLVLTGLVIWMVRQLLALGDKQANAMSQHAVAFTANTEVTRELSNTIRSLSDRLAAQNYKQAELR